MCCYVMFVYCSVFKITSQLKSSKEPMFYVVFVYTMYMYMLPNLNKNYLLTYLLTYLKNVLIVLNTNVDIKFSAHDTFLE